MISPSSTDSAVICRHSGMDSSFTSKRMVPCGVEGVANAFEDAFLVVFYGAGFAVHEFFGVDDFSAERIDYSLVTKTDAQGWDCWA